MLVQLFSQTGNNKTGSFPKVNSKTLTFCNIHERPSSQNNTLSEPIIFTDGTSVINGQNVDDFSSVSNIILSHMVNG